MNAIQGLQGGSSNAQAAAEARRSANVRAQPPREELRTESDAVVEADRLGAGRNVNVAEQQLQKRETEKEEEPRSPTPGQGHGIDVMA